MATGVTNTDGGPGPNPAKPGSKLLAKKNRKWLIVGGAGLGGVLLLKHGNNQASSSSPNSATQDQLSQQAAALAAAESQYGAPVLGTGAQPVTSGGGDIVSKGKSPAVIVNVRSTAGAGSGRPKKPKKPGGGGGGGKNGHGALDKPAHPTDPRGKTPNPKGAHRTKSPPADKKTGHPRPSHRKTPSGAHKHSPAIVESVRGAGDGVVVMGREFPGAVSHTVSGPGRQGGRIITVNYGGRTDRHLVRPDGTWIDQVPGMNPPGRGVPRAATRGTPL